MKRFYNNTLMSGAFSKALRVVALLCVLLGVSSSAWGATTIYFDNTATMWSNVYVCLDAEWVDYYVGNDNVGAVKTQGKTSYQMTKVTGNIYKYDFSSNVSASRVVFIKDNQGNYNNLYNTEASFRGDMNLGTNNMFTVSKSYPKSSNGTTYYNEGTWSNYGSAGGSTCYLTGTFNNWNTSDPNYKMEVNPDNSNEYVIKGVSLNANAEVKVYYDNTFYGKDINVENEDGISISTGNDNNIKFTNAGTYDFYFDKSGNKKIYIGKGTGGGGGGDPDPSAKYYIIGGWDNWTSWNEMQLGSDGYYFYYAATSAQFKISGTASWPDNTWWKEFVKVSSECTTMSKNDNGGNVYLNVSNVYIKYNASTGYLWTEAVQCTEAPVYTVPSSFAMTFGESINLNNICSSTSDADITYTIKSGSNYATLSGSTLKAKSAAGTVTIQASQALNTPYCSGSTEFTIEVVEKSNVLLAEDAVKNANESWTLSGYLEKTDCKEIAEYGFFLCGAE